MHLLYEEGLRAATVQPGEGSGGILGREISDGASKENSQTPL